MICMWLDIRDFINPQFHDTSKWHVEDHCLGLNILYMEKRPSSEDEQLTQILNIYVAIRPTVVV